MWEKRQSLLELWNIVAWQTYLEASENYVRQVCVCLGEGRGASNGRVGNDIGQVVVGGKVVVSGASGIVTHCEEEEAFPETHLCIVTI